MMIKYSFVFLITFFLPFQISGQGSYIEKDSATTIGIKLIDGGEKLNSKFCQVKKDGNIIQYSAIEVKEYGFEKGRVYISKDIQTNDTSIHRVFLERLINGKTSLYYYRGKGVKTYFIEKDSSLFTELAKGGESNETDFNEKLLNITSDCENISDAVKLVSYNKKSLSTLIDRYNKCELKPFPFFRYGFILGYGFTKLNPSPGNEMTYLSEFDYKYDPSYILGVFIDCPIFVSYYSFHTELLYSGNGYSYTLRTGNRDYDLVINTTSLSLPLLLRYTIPSKSIRPYFELGAIYTYNLRNESTKYESIIDGSLIDVISVSEESLIPENQAGFSIGAGVQYNLSLKNILSLGLRYYNQYPVGNSSSFSNKSFQIISSISF